MFKINMAFLLLPTHQNPHQSFSVDKTKANHDSRVLIDKANYDSRVLIESGRSVKGSILQSSYPVSFYAGIIFIIVNYKKHFLGVPSGKSEGHRNVLVNGQSLQ